MERETEQEFTHGPMEPDTMESGRMESNKEVECSLTRTDPIEKERIAMARNTGLQFKQTQMAQKKDRYGE